MKLEGLRDPEGLVVPGRPLGRGGEGAVFELVGQPGLALKMYFEPDRMRESKASAIVHGGFTSNCPSAALPRSIVRNSEGVFVGFTMRKVLDARPLHDLYGSSSRRIHFPAADWRMVVRTAINVACAVSEVHAAGLVIGDMNHSSLLVSPRSLVTLIDADSWQIGPGHNCRVGVPEYTPPELQGRSLDGLLRTEAHDSFGLAVLLAQLLFVGRHPFAGVPIGQPMSLPEAIARHQFAYTLVREVRLRPPKGTLLLSDFPPALRVGFERAFGNMLGDRYTAAKWASVLTECEKNLFDCPLDSRHCVPLGVSSCPWCRIKRVTGQSVFGTDASAPSRPGLAKSDPEIDRMRNSLEKIDAIKLDRIEPPPSKAVSRRSADAAAFALKDSGAAHAALLRSVAVLMGGVSNDRYTRRHTAAEINLVRALTDWRRRIGAERAFLETAALRRSMASEARLASESKRIWPCATTCAAVEVALRATYISDARIPGLATHRGRVLAAAGVLTAADVSRSRLASIVGLGRQCAASLLVWRDEVAASAAPADAADRARANRAQLTARAKSTQGDSRRHLLQTHRNLRRAVARVERLVASNDAAVDRARSQVAVATADLRFLCLPLPGQSCVPATMKAARVANAFRATKISMIGKGRRKISAKNKTTGNATACPKCGSLMTRRWGGGGARRVFLGCTFYPICDGKRSAGGRRI